MIRSKKKQFSFICLLIFIVKSVFPNEIETRILVTNSSMPFKNSTVNSKSSSTRLELLEEEVSKLNQKFLLLEHQNTDAKNSDKIVLNPEIKRISKIVDELKTNEESARSKMSQLNRRVSRLEMAQHEGNEFANNQNRMKRGTKQILNSTPVPCTIRACAFDSKVKSDKSTKEKIPKNCKDLYDMGHVLDGFYHIQADEKIELVCDFRSLKTKDFETRIGYIDIKSSPVYFFVQKKLDHMTLNTPVPFEVEKMNIGKAFDIQTGVFTAPKPGIYCFAFTGIRHHSGEETKVYLQLNYKNIACGHGTGTSKKGRFTMALVSILHLQKGDRVSLVLIQGSISSFNLSINFIGWLVEEDITIDH